MQTAVATKISISSWTIEFIKVREAGVDIPVAEQKQDGIAEAASATFDNNFTDISVNKLSVFGDMSANKVTINSDLATTDIVLQIVLLQNISYLIIL